MIIRLQKNIARTFYSKKKETMSSCSRHCESFQFTSIQRSLKRWSKPWSCETKNLYRRRCTHTKTSPRLHVKNTIASPLLCLHFTCVQSTVMATYEIFKVALMLTGDHSLVCHLCVAHKGCICMQIDFASRETGLSALWIEKER